MNAIRCRDRLSLVLAVVLYPAVLMRAAQTNVSVVDFAFSPSTVTINVNDSVKWVWAGNNHSTTSSSTPRLWDSGLHNSGFTFTNVFSSTGNFPYFCSAHTFMTGSVTVQS